MDAPKPLEKPDLYIVARFLDRLWTPDGVPSPSLSRTKLQQAVGLKYELFVRYVEFLRERDFIELHKVVAGEQVRLSTKGRLAHKQLVQWLREMFGDSALTPRGRARSSAGSAPGPSTAT